MVEKTINERFPNLHSKTAAAIATATTILTWLFCESGLIHV